MHAHTQASPRHYFLQFPKATCSIKRLRLLSDVLVHSSISPGLGVGSRILSPPVAPMRYTVSTDGHATSAATLAASLRAQWDEVPTGGLYSYPARLAPSAALVLLDELPRGTLLDPFCGSGTTLIEALRSKREAIGSDASPLALFVAAHRTWRPGTADVDTLWAQVVEATQEDAVTARKPRSWAALSKAVARVEATHHWPSVPQSCEAAGLLPLSFCVAAAIQRSERYKLSGSAVDVIGLFRSVAREYVEMLRAESSDEGGSALLLHNDARRLELPSGSVDALMTSPPYPGVYDYMSVAREERVRLSPGNGGGRRRGGRRSGRASHSTSGTEKDAAAEVVDRSRVMGLATVPSGRAWPAGWNSDWEMGARKAMRRDLQSFGMAWQQDQERWLAATRRHLQPGGRGAIVIGDGGGIDTLDSTRRAAEVVGLRVVACASIRSDVPVEERLQGNRRTEHALLLEAP